MTEPTAAPAAPLLGEALVGLREVFYRWGMPKEAREQVEAEVAALVAEKERAAYARGRDDARREKDRPARMSDLLGPDEAKRLLDEEREAHRRAARRRRGHGGAS